MNRAALPILLTAAFVTTLDFFIANVALPAIRADLGAGEAATQLVIAAYGLAYAAGVIIAGRLGDLYGPRRVFVSGLALFTLASAACGAAPTPALLVAARVVQGIAAALMAPQVLTLLRVLYQGADRAKAFSWYGTAVGMAGIAGQVVGGVLVTADLGGLGWRACFLINVPLGLAALAFAHRLPEAAGRAGGRLDALGAVLVAGGLVAIVLPLAHGREQGWPLWSWLLLAAAAPLLFAFVRRQRQLKEPLLDLELFGDRGFVRGLAAVALLFGGSSGLSFALALYLQDGLGLNAAYSGAVFTALNAGFLTASILARRTKMPVAGAILLAAGLVLIGQFAAEPAIRLVPGLFLAGAGMSLVMSPLLEMVLARASADRAGSAAGVLGTVQEAGGVAGVTVAGLVFFGAYDAGGWTSALHATLAVLTAAALAVAMLTHLVGKGERRLPSGEAPFKKTV